MKASGHTIVKAESVVKFIFLHNAAFLRDAPHMILELSEFFVSLFRSSVLFQRFLHQHGFSPFGFSNKKKKKGNSR